MSPIYTLAGCCVCASVQCAACSVVLCMQMNVKCRHMGYQQIKLLIYRLAEQNDNRGICSLLVVWFTRLQTEMVISNRIQLSKSANSYQSANQNGNQPIRMQISKPEWQSATWFKSATSCKSANPNADQQTRKPMRKSRMQLPGHPAIQAIGFPLQNPGKAVGGSFYRFVIFTVFTVFAAQICSIFTIYLRSLWTVQWLWVEKSSYVGGL